MIRTATSLLSILLCSGLAFPLTGNVKETHKLIEEWVKTELLRSEESNQWRAEKAALIDLQAALNQEIEELDESLKTFESEETTLEEERAKLMERKREAEKSTLALYEGLQNLQTEIDRLFKILPAPLRNNLSPFREKLASDGKETDLPLRKRLEIAVSILQSIHLFNRSVTMERVEFTLDDDKSREFIVLYFGLGVAYFVNESGTVAGFGKPTEQGWAWTRQDDLASEISTGIDMMKNRTLPRFLELNLPSPERLGR
tara:strand:- start:315 stop:1088 length:774 start_codon:yes stop_codon:yes gene_type:complete